jgi:hypothetical protein
MLPIQTIQRLERLLAGDPEVEQAVLLFIRHKYAAQSLAHLSETAAKEICRRPYDFVKAAKQYHTPELF